jgi:hypothetical protein
MPSEVALPLLVVRGVRTTLRYASRYADASKLEVTSWAGGGSTPFDAVRKFEVMRGPVSPQVLLPTTLLRLFVQPRRSDAGQSEARFGTTRRRHRA